MQIVCDQCQATYELDPPAAPFVRDQNLVFRCTACGHSIPLRRGESQASESSVLDAPERPEPPAQGFLLRQEGKVYQVRDQAMLQRWIAERRIWRTDEISADGSTWLKAGEMDECAVFFTLVDQAEQASSASSASGKGLFARPNTGDPLSSLSMSSPDPSEVNPQPVEEATTVEASEEIEEISDPDEDTSIVEVEEVTPLRLAVEAIPEEEPARLTMPENRLNPDEPTMDMELGEEDFFSEESQAVDTVRSMESGLGSFDDELEWTQMRRKNMTTWWLLFFGALGGVGYFSLDFLNQKDAAVEVEPTTEPADVEPQEPAIAAEPAPAAADDSGEATAETEEKPAEDEGAQQTEDAVAEAEPAAAPSPAPAPAAAPPAPRAAAPASAAPARVNPGREINRGWSRIDREDWSGARTHFNNALTADPGNGDAKFGMAYVNENQGRVEEAVRQYCSLQATGTGESKAEAAGRLRALARECP